MRASASLLAGAIAASDQHGTTCYTMCPWPTLTKPDYPCLTLLQFAKAERWHKHLHWPCAPRSTWRSWALPAIGLQNTTICQALPVPQQRYWLATLRGEPNASASAQAASCCPTMRRWWSPRPLGPWPSCIPAGSIWAWAVHPAPILTPCERYGATRWRPNRISQGKSQNCKPCWQTLLQDNG